MTEARTWAIPFDRVWREALALASGADARWAVEGADDGAGVIEASVRKPLGRSAAAVRICVSLDQDGQTLVTVQVPEPGPWPGSALCRRQIRRFLDGLEAGLAPRARSGGGRAR